MKSKKTVNCQLSIIFLIVLLFNQPLKAQVTIGSQNVPDGNALLDLRQNTADSLSSKGLLLPRVSLTSAISSSPLTAHVKGMFVYNTATTSTGANDVTPGVYFDDGAKWIKESDSATPTFFYMPSILLPVDASDPAYNSGNQTFTVDLYAQYAAQFGLTATASSVKSPGATASLPIYSKTQLGYYVTYFDSAVFSSVSVDNNGVITYKLVSAPVFSDKTYMNIVFEVKP